MCSEKDIRQWLQKKCTEYDPTETTFKLLLCDTPYKYQEKLYKLDHTANEISHHVIRLRLYHCQYNTITLTWAKVNGEVTHLINTFRLRDVQRLMNETTGSH
jgi:hypothetical protein